MGAIFNQVRTDDEIDLCAALAKEIVSECSISCQCECSIDEATLRTAIAQQVEQGTSEFYLIRDGEDNVGILSFQPQSDGTPHSNLYLSDKHRGKGYAAEAFSFLEGFCRARKFEAIWLNVNKNSRRTIEVYKIKGFSTMRFDSIPMGSDCLMNDFCIKPL